MRKIVFVGNCQGRRLQEFYDENFTSLNGDTTAFVVSYEPFTDHVRQLLRSADVIVAQVIDSEHSVDVSKAETTAQFVLYPNVTGVFLWPYSGVEHIFNKPLPYYWDGPYGREFGDRWLNRKIEAGASPAEIVDEYLSLDIAKAVNLDRMRELVMDRARQRDEKTGFNTAALIEASLTTEKLFKTPANLETALFNQLARGVYARLGISSADVDHALSQIWRSPFPSLDAPIHPAVARHFDLKFITPETRYRSCTGERLTFREWAERYVRYEWNDTLLKATTAAGEHRNDRSDFDETLALLKNGLEGTRGSDSGYSSLGHLYLLKGEKEAASQAMLQAEEFDPRNPQFAVNVIHMIADRGDLDVAEPRMSALTVKWPSYADGYARLASIQERQGRGPNAMDSMSRALALEPRNIDFHALHVHIAERFGREEEAIRAFAAAVGRAPFDAPLHVAFAGMLTRKGRVAEALVAIDRSMSFTAKKSGALGDAGLLSQKGEILLALGRSGEAGAAFAEAVALESGDSRVYENLAAHLTSLGRPNDATAAIGKVIALNPGNARLLARLASQMSRSGLLAEAERLLRQAIELDWNDAGPIGELGDVLHKKGDAVGAIMALHRAIQLNPRDARLRERQSEIMIERGDFAGAEKELTNAAESAPKDANIRASLALLFIRQQKFESALYVADNAVALDPGNPHLLARKAHILSELGDFTAAERMLEQALAISPTLGGLHAILGGVFMSQGRRRDAKSAFLRALEHEPDHAGYLAQLEMVTRAMADVP